MPVITVITATPPLPNPGMASVDYALYAMFQRHNIQANLNFFQLYSSNERNFNLDSNQKFQLEQRQKLPIIYNSLRGQLEEIYASDVIIYWGDFFHSRDYLYHVASTLLQIGIVKNEKDAFESVYRYFFLKDAPNDIYSRTLGCGGTLIFNRARDYQEKNYTDNLYNFVKKVRRLWMREIYSAHRINMIKEDNNFTSLGVDCSLFLRNEDINALPRSKIFTQKLVKNKVGVFFGRTKANINEMYLFTKQLCKRRDLKAEWIPWFSSFSPIDPIKKAQACFPELIEPSYSSEPLIGDILSSLINFKLIITDTYHVCLNAWRAGIPTICIGDLLPTQAYDVSAGWQYAWRDKRQVFYSMYDAMEFFINQNELKDPASFKDRLDYMSSLLNNHSLIDFIINNMKKQAEIVENAFVSQLIKLI